MATVHGSVARKQKKAAGNAARGKETNASKVLDSPAKPPSSNLQRCRERRLRTAKKRRVPNPSYDASPPLPKGTG